MIETGLTGCLKNQLKQWVFSYSNSPELEPKPNALKHRLKTPNLNLSSKKKTVYKTQTEIMELKNRS